MFFFYFYYCCQFFYCLTKIKSIYEALSGYNLNHTITRFFFRKENGPKNLFACFGVVAPQLQAWSADVVVLVFPINSQSLWISSNLDYICFYILKKFIKKFKFLNFF